MAACFDPATPEQLITGSITDDLGIPIEGAIVAISPEQFTTTDADGTFELRSPEGAPRGPLTASARGFTAWTLDTTSLSRFTARLKPQTSIASTSSIRTVTAQIFFEEPLQEERFLLAQTDTGAQFPFLLPDGFGEYTLELSAPSQTRTIALFSPSTLSAPALWSGASPVRLSTPANAPDILLSEAPISQLRLPPFSLEENSSTRINALVSCARPRQSPLTVGQDTQTTREPSFVLDLFPFEDLGVCTLIASFNLPTSSFGEVRHVGFLRDISPPPNTPAKADELLFPEAHTLIPIANPSTQTIRWERADDATLYDVYLAPRNADDTLGAPLWSCSTSSNNIEIPNLPVPAIQAIGFDPDARYAIRVIARMVPGLDLEDNWDWSTYYGYITSPWVDLPIETLGWN